MTFGAFGLPVHADRETLSRYETSQSHKGSYRFHLCASAYVRMVRPTCREGQERFGLGAKLAAGVDLSESEGTSVPLPLEGVRKVVPMIVASKDSPAKQAGNDLCFMACSRECGEALRRALAEEIGGIDGFSSM